jgi:hypothetical protein
MSHYIKQCKKCGDIISQCRCPSTDKTITFDLCNRCKVVVLEDEIRAVINSIPEDYREKKILSQHCLFQLLNLFIR